MPNDRLQNGQMSNLRLTKGSTKMGCKDSGTLPPVWDKYEKMETMTRGLLPKVPPTRRNKSLSHTMPSNGGHPNLDNSN